MLLDEVGSLGSTRFEHVMATCQRSDLGCALVFFGDFGPLGSPDGSAPANEHHHWAKVTVMRLRQCLRTVDPVFQRSLTRMRLRMCGAPDRNLLGGNRILDVVCAEALVQHLVQHPNCVLLAVRVSDVAWLNALCLEGLFGEEAPLRVVPVVSADHKWTQPVYIINKESTTP